MAKHIVKISILLVWLTIMGWWWLESRSWPPPAKVEVAFLPDFNDYFSLKYGDQKIGWAFKNLRRLPGGAGYQVGQGLVVRLALAGEELEINSTLMANLDQSLNLLDFTHLVQAGPLTVSESGVVADERLSIEVNLGEHRPLLAKIAAASGGLWGQYAENLDFSRPAILPAPVGPALAQALPPYLSYLGLEPGRHYALKQLNPLSRQLEEFPVRVEEEGREYDQEAGRKIPAFRIRLTSAGGDSLIWVDRFGRTFREEAVGFTLTRLYEQSEAGQGITPLTPPPGFEQLLSLGRKLKHD